MSINNLLVPNNYQLYANELLIYDDVKIGGDLTTSGAVIAGNGLIFNSTAEVLSSLANPLEVGLLNNGIIVLNLDPGAGGVLQLPSAQAIVQHFPAVLPDDTLSFTITAGVAFLPNTGLDHYLVVNPGAGGTTLNGFQSGALYFVSGGTNLLALTTNSRADVCSRTYFVKITSTTPNSESYLLL